MPQATHGLRASLFGKASTPMASSAPASGGYLDVDAAFKSGSDSFSSTASNGYGNGHGGAPRAYVMSERSSSLHSDPNSITPRSHGGGSLSNLGARRSASPTASPRDPMRGRYSELLGATIAPELPPIRRRQLVEFIDRSLDDAYNLCYGFGRLRWEHLRTRDGIVVCGAVSKDGDTHLDATVRSKGAITATFDELMDLLITETTEDFVELEEMVNPQEFLDGQVLYVLVPRTPTDRFVCVKWHCVKSLAPSVAKHRDYVYVEAIDHFVDQDGKKIGVRLCRSIELEELARFDTSAMFVRAKTMMLQTFAATASGPLEMHSMVLNEAGGRLPTWLLQKIMDHAAMRPARLRDYIDRRRMELLVLARPRQVVPLSSRGCCGICTKSFSIVRKKYNCVACGDVMCSQCSLHQMVSMSLLDELVKRRKARICVKCSTAAKTKELPRRKSRCDSDPRHGANAGGTRRAASQTQLYPNDKPQVYRNARSFSTLDTASTDSAVEEERFTSCSSRSNSNIPQMFQFRPTPMPGNRASDAQSGRSSLAMTASSSPGELAAVNDPHDERGSSGSTASSAPKMDLGVGKYRASFTRDEEPTNGGDEEDGMTSPSTGSPSSSPAPRPSAIVVEELEIADMTVSAPSQVRLSESSEVKVVKPVMIKPMKRKSFGRKSSLHAPPPAVFEEELVPAADSSLVGRRPAPPPPVPGPERRPAPPPPMMTEQQRQPAPEPPVMTRQPAPEPPMVVEQQRQPAPELPVFTERRPAPEPPTSVEQRRPAPEPPIVEQPRRAAPPPPLPQPRRPAPELPVVVEQERSPAPSPPQSTGAPQRTAAPPPPVEEVERAPATLERDPAPLPEYGRASLMESDEATATALLEEALGENAEQLADFRMHLNRMSMITKGDQVKHADHLADPTIMGQAISQTEKKAQAEAAIVASLIDAGSLMRGSMDARPSLMSRPSFLESRPSMLCRPSFVDTTRPSLMSRPSLGPSDQPNHAWRRDPPLETPLGREDGGFTAYLADSTFTDVGPGETQMANGWKAVHPKTTGRVYYYNATCGRTSWTPPLPETTRNDSEYIVL